MTVNKNRDRDTLDLFQNTPHGGDGQTNPVGRTAPTPLPELANVELVVPEPLSIPAPMHPEERIPVFSISLVCERSHLTRQIHTPADIVRLGAELVAGRDREVFYAIALSTANRVIGAHLCHIGTLDCAIASPRELYKFALLCNARSVIVLHNHPSGNLSFSEADIQISRQMKTAGEHLGIKLLDSIVYGFDGKYNSMVEKGLL